MSPGFVIIKYAADLGSDQFDCVSTKKVLTLNDANDFVMAMSGFRLLSLDGSQQTPRFTEIHGDKIQTCFYALGADGKDALGRVEALLVEPVALVRVLESV